MTSNYDAGDNNYDHNDRDESDGSRETALGPDEFSATHETELSFFVGGRSITGLDVLGERLESRMGLRAERREDNACANQPERRED